MTSLKPIKAFDSSDIRIACLLTARDADVCRHSVCFTLKYVSGDVMSLSTFLNNNLYVSTTEGTHTLVRPQLGQCENVISGRFER
jgi:hypothetical protein